MINLLTWFFNAKIVNIIQSAPNISITFYINPLLANIVALCLSYRKLSILVRTPRPLLKIKMVKQRMTSLCHANVPKSWGWWTSTKANYSWKNKLVILLFFYFNRKRYFQIKTPCWSLLKSFDKLLLSSVSDFFYWSYFYR